MPRKPKAEKTPKGMTVPVPRRADFFANLKEAAKPDKNPSDKPARRTRKK